MASSKSSRYELQNRYVFKGQIVMQTALHIGGGRVTLSSSASPIVLTPEQKPFIPGSSFKGSLRSTVEKIASGLPGLKTCALIELDKEELETRRRDKEWICSTLRQEEFAARRRAAPDRGKAILQEEIDGLCDTCRLFGSPFTAAHLNVNDLYMPKEVWNGITQIRDGVVIDRDSEKARDRLKYDFEVVPASATFDLEIVLENASPKDLQLLCVGLSEFVHGFGVIGGKRSRGLGVCKLQNLTVSSLELKVSSIDQKDISPEKSRERLKNYLINRDFSTPPEPGEQFLSRHIERIFAKEG